LISTPGSKGWILIKWHSPNDVCVIAGVISNDQKSRFADGRTILTSALLTPASEARESSVVQTMNSRYLLGEQRKRD